MGGRRNSSQCAVTPPVAADSPVAEAVADSTRQAVRLWGSAAAVWYPFTLLGSALFLAATYLLGSAFASGSPYEFVLAIAAYLILLVLAGLCRLQAYRFSLADFEWNTGNALHARSAEEQTLSTRSEQAKLFFRIHFGVWWRLRLGHRAALVGYGEVAGGGGVLPISFFLPAAGAVSMRGAIAVRDIFGLCRAQLRRAERRDLTVLPALLGEQAAPPVDISVGLDTTQRAKTADEEKYFMREYMAGDRMKDINWKATSRLNEMITRISPVTQERTQLLHLVLRPYVSASDGRRPNQTGSPVPGSRENRDTVFHLDFAKSWLLTFLRVIKLHHPEYTFAVDTGQEVFDVKEMAHIDSLARRLAGIRLRAGGGQGSPTMASAAPGDRRADELFVFSTAFDADLQRFLNSCGSQRTNVFRTVTPLGTTGTDRPGRDAYRLCVNDSPFPAGIGGPWLWRRERRNGRSEKTDAPTGIRATSVDDQPLLVRYACTPSS